MTDSPDTRDLILEAARAEFQRNGTAGARTQDIADRAGVNKALLHYYFRTKDELAEAVFLRAARSLIPPVMHELGSEHSLEDKVRTVVGLYLGLLKNAPGLPAYVLSELHHHPERMGQFLASVAGADPAELGARVLGVLERQIDDGVKAGQLRPIPAEQFLINLLSLCIFPFAARPMISMVLQGEPDPFASFIEERSTNLPEFFMAALRP